MPSLNLTKYRKEVDRGDVVSSFKTLKSLYAMADNALAKIANQCDDSPETLDLETQLLDDKEKLIGFASKTKCKDVHEISQKVDFLNIVYLTEKSADDLNDTDILTKSIWKDCQVYL